MQDPKCCYTWDYCKDTYTEISVDPDMMSDLVYLEKIQTIQRLWNFLRPNIRSYIEYLDIKVTNGASGYWLQSEKTMQIAISKNTSIPYIKYLFRHEVEHVKWHMKNDSHPGNIWKYVLDVCRIDTAPTPYTELYSNRLFELDWRYTKYANLMQYSDEYNAKIDKLFRILKWHYQYSFATEIHSEIACIMEGLHPKEHKLRITNKCLERFFSIHQELWYGDKISKSQKDIYSTQFWDEMICPLSGPVLEGCNNEQLEISWKSWSRQINLERDKAYLEAWIEKEYDAFRESSRAKNWRKI